MSNRYTGIKDHPITIGNQHDLDVERDPKTMNRVHKVAPCPEVHLLQKEAGEQFHSGGGSRGIKGHTGSGKGSLDHIPVRLLGKKDVITAGGRQSKPQMGQ